MTVFQCIKKAVLRAEGTVIVEAFSSPEQIGHEMADLANEVAADIAKSCDWRALTKVHTITGNGGEAYPLPADYDRMAQASRVSDPGSLLWGYAPVPSVDAWVRSQAGSSPGEWIIMGGEMHFRPAPSGAAAFPYVSNHWARAEDGTPKPEFTSDDDRFALDERLLTLGLIWRWKAQKGLEYGEDLRGYEYALSQEQTRDKGARVISRTAQPRVGTPTFVIAGDLGDGVGADTDYVAIYQASQQ